MLRTVAFCVIAIAALGTAACASSTTRSAPDPTSPTVGMSTIRIITASAAPASSGNAASSVSASAVLSSAARELADLDGDKLPAWAYQHQLDLLAPKCTNGKDNLAGVANATLEDLRKNGIHDETEYSVLQHLNQSVPPGLGKLDCTGIASAYLVLREGH